MNNLERQLCEKIYEHHKERVKWYACKWLYWLNQEDIHDIIQDTWRKLVENIDVVGVLSSPEQFNWLVTVCHNQAVSLVRKQRRVIEQDSETIENLLNAKKAISVEKEVLDKVMLEELLQKLSKEDRAFLYLSEFSSEQEERNRTNAERCKMYRLKRKIKKIFKENGWEG